MTGWKAYFIVLLVTVPAWVGFFPPNMGFPLDDSWVVQVFSGNVRESVGWVFNLGERCGGSTSLLWTWLLSFFPGESAPSFYRQVFAAQALALLLALYPLAGALPVIFSEGLDGTRRFRRFGATFLAALTLSHGVWLFFLFSGLETSVFVSMGVLAIVLYHLSWPWLAGLALGLLISVRPEGYLLALILIGHSFLSGKKNRPRRRDRSGATCVPLILGAHLAMGGVLLHQARFGDPWMAKLLSTRRLQFSLDASEIDWENLGVHSLHYGKEWTDRLNQWFWMNDFLPPWMTIGLTGGYSIHPVTMILNGLMGLGGCLILGRLFRPSGWGRKTPLSLMAIWTAIHNLAYLLFLPVGGQAGRFQSLNYLWPPLLVAIGAQGLSRILQGGFSRKRPYFFRSLKARWGTTMAICFMTLPWFISQGVWNEVLTAGIDRVNSLHQLAGIWSKKNLPPDSRVAAVEPGAYKMASNLSIADPFGLWSEPKLGGYPFDVDPEVLQENGVTHLFLTLAPDDPDPSPDLPGVTALQKVYAADLREEIGIDRKACQNKGSRCAIYRIVYSEPEDPTLRAP